MGPRVDTNLVSKTNPSKPSKGPPPKPFHKTSLFTPVSCPKREGQPQNIPDTAKQSPYDLFRLFFDDTIIDTIVIATNQNAERKRNEPENKDKASHKAKWVPVSNNEIQRFLGKLKY